MSAQSKVSVMRLPTLCFSLLGPLPLSPIYLKVRAGLTDDRVTRFDSGPPLCTISMSSKKKISTQIAALSNSPSWHPALLRRLLARRFKKNVQSQQS